MSFVRISSTLPPLRCPEWTEKDFLIFSKNSARLVEIAKKAGTTSDAFNNSVNKFQYYAKFETIEKLIREITKPVHVRAVIHLLLNDATFRNKVNLSEYLLNALEKPLGRLSNLALMALVRLWFEQFDRLRPEKIINYFGQFILNRLKTKTENPRCSDEFYNLYKYGSLIFQKEGPAKLIDAIPRNKTLEAFFNKPGLQGYENGRFQQICRNIYYIETLNKIPVGTYHSVLDEVKKQEVYGALYKDKLLIGHKILSILIDRSPDENISDSWQNTILTIAGDPRVPKASPRYQKWWAFMSQAQIAKVVGWLSKVDLKLFLEALEEYGRSSGKEDLQRMFPSRKQFLEGLLRQGLVKKSRLFIGNQADTFLRSMYKREDLPSYARVRDTHRSILYLHVGNCHLIEGSHSFKIWIFSKLPENVSIFNYVRREFSVQELSSDLIDSCEKTFGSNFKYTDIRHSPSNFNWQHHAISFLRNAGEKIDLEEIFTKNEYKAYRSMYGV